MPLDVIEYRVLGGLRAEVVVMPGYDDVLPLLDGIADALNVNDVPDIAPALAQVYADPRLL
jgi:hypothetical protein